MQELTHLCDSEGPSTHPEKRPYGIVSERLQKTYQTYLVTSEALCQAEESDCLCKGSTLQHCSLSHSCVCEYLADLDLRLEVAPSSISTWSPLTSYSHHVQC